MGARDLPVALVSAVCGLLASGASVALLGVPDRFPVFFAQVITVLLAVSLLVWWLSAALLDG